MRKVWITVLLCLVVVCTNTNASAKPCGNGYIADNLTCRKGENSGEVDGKTVGLFLGGIALLALVMWAAGAGIRERQKNNERDFREIQRWEDDFLRESEGSLVWRF